MIQEGGLHIPGSLGGFQERLEPVQGGQVTPELEGHKYPGWEFCECSSGGFKLRWQGGGDQKAGARTRLAKGILGEDDNGSGVLIL